MSREPVESAIQQPTSCGHIAKQTATHKTLFGSVPQNSYVACFDRQIEQLQAFINLEVTMSIDCLSALPLQ